MFTWVILQWRWAVPVPRQTLSIDQYIFSLLLKVYRICWWQSIKEKSFLTLKQYRWQIWTFCDNDYTLFLWVDIKIIICEITVICDCSTHTISLSSFYLLFVTNLSTSFDGLRAHEAEQGVCERIYKGNWPGMVVNNRKQLIKVKLQMTLFICLGLHPVTV